ncbi:3-phosphoshikimate 1-carboxyvinyltransferase [Serratia symbiotica str. 'Cinara cedri']|nr:3-phosphoshikimate 1-carboxyvinyltransferase [Serratia symbiotica str. 'Cinara cedri']
MHLLTLRPVALVNGTVNLPGSKSVSNRVLLLAALAEGKTRLLNLLDSDDVRYMLNALEKLGVNCWFSIDRTVCQVDGLAGPLAVDQPLKLFLGNAGTVMRSLAAVLCLSHSDVILTSNQRMKERPIGPLVDALRQGCAKIDYLEQPGYPPVHLHGGFLGGDITVDSSISSQFLTALLMIAPLAPQNTQIYIKGELVSKPYIKITLHLMECFGIKVSHYNYQAFQVKGCQTYRSPGYYLVEGDASSASYFLAAGAIKGGRVRVIGVGCKSIQGDIQFANVLEKMGAHLIWGHHFIECSYGILRGIDMDMNSIPDAAMTVATTALFAKGPTTLRNIYNWRVKETDRLAAMSKELRKVGAEVDEGRDYIHVVPPSKLNAAVIDTYNDHRMAMCFSLLALSGTPVTLINPQCIAKTFPYYFKQLAQIIQLA